MQKTNGIIIALTDESEMMEHGEQISPMHTNPYVQAVCTSSASSAKKFRVDVKVLVYFVGKD